ncbi:Vacuolar protein sorting 4b [Giardia muris]|uniref:Vacuolar protein sorting 4b n=1 Tax=Giardia muris TaxID=5742 RepID=A0A4Z1T0S4_GIAMU|nr:Vacuolar protein sorting 4b [Giardia muris]|eukprot:TNJ26507.1 Vacuolar protein sorting 4b [Giardia muris]
MTRLALKGSELIERGTQAERAKDFSEALSLYKQGCRHIVESLKFLDGGSRTYYENILQTIVPRAEKIKKRIAAGPEAAALGGGGGKKDPLEDALSRVIVREKPNIHWDDVVGLQGAKQALNEAVVLPIKFPHLFEGKREPWRGILLYGCPGTGKSFLAKALATECDATFFSVSSSDLISKYVGESARLIRALFDMARKEPQAIIFIDEIDALVSSRGGGEESDASRQVKTEFLVQMQGVGKGAGNLLVLGATNFPEAIDSAMLRRFEKRIEIDLPDAEARASILKNGIGDTPNTLTDADYMKLANDSEGYSGSDLSNLCKEALMMPIRELQTAQFYRADEAGKYYICNEGDPGAIAGSIMDLDPNSIGIPRVTPEHMQKALASTKSSVTKEDKVRIAKFTSDCGSQ